MTATEVLRRLLDERGVEWDGESYESVTFWNEETNMAVASDDFDGRLWVSQRLTPEQAIAATLGQGTCKLTMDGTDGCFGCSECLENIPPLANYCPNCGRRIVDEKEDA